MEAFRQPSAQAPSPHAMLQTLNRLGEYYAADPDVISEIEALRLELLNPNVPSGPNSKLVYNFYELFRSIVPERTSTQPESTSSHTDRPLADPTGAEEEGFVLRIDLPPPGAGETLARIIADGLLMGFADEIYAIMESIVTDTPYAEALETYRERTDLATEHNPGVAGVAGVLADVGLAFWNPLAGAARRLGVQQLAKPAGEIGVAAVDGFGAGESLPDRLLFAGLGVANEALHGQLWRHSLSELNAPRALDIAGNVAIDTGLGLIDDRYRDAISRAGTDEALNAGDQVIENQSLAPHTTDDNFNRYRANPLGNDPTTAAPAPPTGEGINPFAALMQPLDLSTIGDNYIPFAAITQATAAHGVAPDVPKMSDRIKRDDGSTAAAGVVPTRAAHGVFDAGGYEPSDFVNNAPSQPFLVPLKDGTLFEAVSIGPYEMNDVLDGASSQSGRVGTQPAGSSARAGGVGPYESGDFLNNAPSRPFLVPLKDGTVFEAVSIGPYEINNGSGSASSVGSGTASTPLSANEALAEKISRYRQSLAPGAGLPVTAPRFASNGARQRRYIPASGFNTAPLAFTGFAPANQAATQPFRVAAKRAANAEAPPRKQTPAVNNDAPLDTDPPDVWMTKRIKQVEAKNPLPKPAPLKNTTAKSTKKLISLPPLSDKDTAEEWVQSRYDQIAKKKALAYG